MFPLDSKTVQRLAQVIVDAGGPYERKGWQLARLLRDSGWHDAPDYDGSARVPWLIDQIGDHRDDHAAIERLICRTCDPLEYDGGMTSAEEFRTVVNERLAPEQLVVTYVSGRPVLGEVGADGAKLLFSEPPDVEGRLARLIRDDRTVRVLLKRLQETRICESGGAYTFAIIGIGSFVEGMLLAMLTERDEQWQQNDVAQGKGPRIRPDRASLELLIDTVHTKGWIQLDAAGFMHKVRDYRNFVHPRKEMAEQPDFDRDSVGLCWAPVHAMLNDLEARLG
ncbi:MAG: hypothetical protein ACRDRN_20570 [Sciscionella sp.]